MDFLAPLPNRGSLVLRLDGTDPDAPSLCLIGHTDVVPVNPSTWSRDPFGGEVVDGETVGPGGGRHAQSDRKHGRSCPPPAQRGFSPARHFGVRCRG